MKGEMRVVDYQIQRSSIEGVCKMKNYIKLYRAQRSR